MSDATLPPTVDPREQPTCAELSVGSGTCPVVERVGDYELLSELGRGGMGVVFKARDARLNRFVAVKMILPAAMPDETDLERFQTEASAAGRLHHPNIVAVHAVGQQDGRWFYCMDLIEGPSLAKRIAGGPLPGRTAARYMVGVARGIDHAHRNGVLHRDLKPANILLDADDQPHVADFGLAKQMKTDQHGCTRTGSILGTPSYMAPEQASGSKEIGPACDVYGLGALLYELLTGRPPFRAETPLDTLLQVLERDPAPPRLLNPKVDRDLENICLKCLQKDPARRYPSAAMMAEDLERYLNGESIRARTFSMIDRLAWTLEHSQYDVQFGPYGAMLYWFAAIVLGTQLVKHVLLSLKQPVPWVVVCQAVEFLLIGVVFALHRRKSLLSSTTAERQLWSVWIGYIVASVLIALSGWTEFTGEKAYQAYPYFTITAGMAFFFLGSSYWGWCYAFGLAFFALSGVMLLDMRWAVLEFGALWAVCLLILGTRLRWLAKERAEGSKAI
ncbi:MAG TPA: serine/threonine-protein kinase [Gemmataceae bacterium]|nr:serine/threonine-protein kinase [Gemmataceae bacterium]